MSECSFHHLGIIVPDRNRLDGYIELLGLPVQCDEYVPAFDCDCIFVGDGFPSIELILPHGGPLAAFNDGAGGLHHCAFQTPDLGRHMRHFMEGRGRWLYPSPRKGARGMLVNFIAAEALCVMTEFVEEDS